MTISREAYLDLVKENERLKEELDAQAAAHAEEIIKADGCLGLLLGKEECGGDQPLGTPICPVCQRDAWRRVAEGLDQKAAALAEEVKNLVDERREQDIGPICESCWSVNWSLVETEAECAFLHPHDGQHRRCDTCWLQEEHLNLMAKVRFEAAAHAEEIEFVKRTMADAMERLNAAHSACILTLQSRKETP